MKKKIILLGGLGLLVIIGIAVFTYLSQPPKEKLSDEFKEQAVTKLLGRKAQLTDDGVPTGDILYEGNHITFLYPAKALIYTYRGEKTSSTSGKLDDFSFDVKDPRLVFNMTVIPNSSKLSQIADYPAVRLREQRSYEYKKSTIKIGTAQGSAYFRDAGDSEKSGFFLTNGKIYSITVTGSQPTEVEKLFDSILASAKLK